MSGAYATIGRAPDNDVVLDDPSVSGHHARLAWSDGKLLVEDLSSANGTFVDGERVTRVTTRAGAELRVGRVPVPWGHPGLKRFLKAGGGKRTLLMPARGNPGEPPPARAARGGVVLAFVIGFLLVGAAAVAFVLVEMRGGAPLGETLGETLRDPMAAVRDAEAEQRIGGETAVKIAKALTPMDAVTRNTAVKLAAKTAGPFHVEQVAEIWGAVRRQWKYVNDPAGREYFATATESINNGYVGDCDDFAITLMSMVTAIGGKARIVLMDGPGGGHAYAEACVEGEPTKVAATLTRHYKNKWKKYVGANVPKTIAFRASAECPVWLNLDWNSVVPGGAYAPETWAVAIYEGGRMETLAPAQGEGRVPPATPQR